MSETNTPTPPPEPASTTPGPKTTDASSIHASNQLAAQVALSNKKSLGLALLLALFFGPLGLLYASILGGIVMFLVNLIIAIPTLGVGLLLTWPLTVLWAFLAINKHNGAIDRQVLGQALS